MESADRLYIFHTLATIFIRHRNHHDRGIDYCTSLHYVVSFRILGFGCWVVSLGPGIDQTHPRQRLEQVQPSIRAESCSNHHMFLFVLFLSFSPISVSPEHLSNQSFDHEQTRLTITATTGIIFRTIFISDLTSTTTSSKLSSFLEPRIDIRSNDSLIQFRSVDEFQAIQRIMVCIILYKAESTRCFFYPNVSQMCAMDDKPFLSKPIMTRLTSPTCENS